MNSSVLISVLSASMIWTLPFVIASKTFFVLPLLISDSLILILIGLVEITSANSATSLSKFLAFSATDNVRGFAGTLGFSFPSIFVNTCALATMIFLLSRKQAKLLISNESLLNHLTGRIINSFRVHYSLFLEAFYSTYLIKHITLLCGFFWECYIREIRTNLKPLLRHYISFFPFHFIDVLIGR